MYTAISNLLNSILATITKITNAANFASNPIGAVFGSNSTGSNENDTTQGQTDESKARNTALPEKEKQTQSTVSKRSPIIIPETISARFNDTGSPAWKNQPGGRHLGTDFSAPNGSAVYAPYDMQVVRIGHYEDEGKKGDYVIGYLGDGTQYYSGHLSNVLVSPNSYVKAGTRIASIGYYNHTHIQLRVNSQLYDFEEYEKVH